MADCVNQEHRDAFQFLSSTSEKILEQYSWFDRPTYFVWMLDDVSEWTLSFDGKGS